MARSRYAVRTPPRAKNLRAIRAPCEDRIALMTRIHRVLAGALFCLLLATCTGRGHPVLTDKNTNWLRACQLTAECGPGLACVSGLCTIQCRATSECAELSTAARCTQLLPSGCAPTAAARGCTLLCDNTAQCALRGDGLSCVAGACISAGCESRDASVAPDARGTADARPGSGPSSSTPDALSDTGASRDSSRDTPVNRDAGASVDRDASVSSGGTASALAQGGAGGAPNVGSGGASLTGAGGTNGTGGSGDGGRAPSGTLESIFTGTALPEDTGLVRFDVASFDGNQVFLAPNGGGSVTRIDHGVRTIYLTPDDLGAINAPGGGSSLPATGVDMGPDGFLYVLTQVGVMRSNAPHAGAVYRPFSTITMFSVGDSNEIGGYGPAGLWRLAPTSLAPVYDQAAINGISDCALTDYVLQPSGAFIYQRGCNGSGVFRGNMDGTGLKYVFQVASDQIDGQGFSNVLCSARAPDGGFYALMELLGGTFTVHLYHLAPDFDAGHGMQELRTTPTFDDANGAGTFFYCGMNTSRDGRYLFVAAGDRLWRVTL